MLMILHVFGTTIGTAPGICRMLPAEYHVHKVDFYLRNPDYLAEALMDRAAEVSGAERDGLLADVGAILAAKEPDLFRIPMRRLFRGAYESLNEVEAFLTARGLILRRSERRKEPDGQRRYIRTRYLLTETGCALVDELLGYEEARWYHDRCALIAERLGTKVAEFKAQQYRQAEYADTPLQALIPPITARVVARARDEFGIGQ
jgi:hypothetical protein